MANANSNYVLMMGGLAAASLSFNGMDENNPENFDHALLKEYVPNASGNWPAHEADVHLSNTPCPNAMDAET